MYESHATVLQMLSANQREAVRRAVPFFVGLADHITVGQAVDAWEEEKFRERFDREHQGDNMIPSYGESHDDHYYPPEK